MASRRNMSWNVWSSFWSRERARKTRRVRRVVLESLEKREVLSGPTGGANIAPMTSTVLVTFTKTSDWGTGFTGQVNIQNIGTTAVSGWNLEFDFAPNIDSIWNAGIVSRVGSHYVLKDAGYNASIAPGATTSFGFNGSPGNLTITPQNYIFNGVPVGSNAPTPSISIADSSVKEGDVAVASGFLKTLGSQIVDAANQPVRVAGVNWFGLETTNFAPHGLWTRGYKDMMDQMKSLGFNTIRLPYSSQALDANSVPNGIDFSKNADLQGLSPLRIIDKIVDYAGQIGLRIMLDHHRSTAGNSAQENGLWYTPEYSETRWVNDWVMLATRYKGNPTVIGADLHNEPHGQATWGSGNAATDWRLAAEKAGNAILAANPDWLIVVEGVENAKSGSTWWGGNLSSAGDFPVRLNVANRLVYSPHEYPQSVYNQRWFSDPSYPNNLPAIWDQNWGYLFRQNIAPVLIGEFGSKLATTSDVQWMNKLIGYMKGDLDGSGTNDLAAGNLGVSWTYWSWNPNSGDTGGILADDWRTPVQTKVDLLKPVQFNLPSAVKAGTTMDFTVSLSQATSTTVTVSYATVAGTATVPGDFTAVTGTLTFAPGETTKVISVPIVSDTTVEPDEQFRVVLSSPTNATIADGDATGTIVNDDGTTPPTPPAISVGDISLAEGNSGTAMAQFTLTLSKASTSPVTVNYATANGTATAGSDYTASSGVATFAPGVTSIVVSVPVIGDTVVESDETFLLNLSSPANATLTKVSATATIRNDDTNPQPAVPSITVGDISLAEGNSGTSQARFTLTLSQASTSSVTVNYATANGTATAGSDYTAGSGTVTFAPGVTSMVVSVPVIGDTTVEPDETFLLNLSAPTNATLAKTSATATIRNDDTAPSGGAVVMKVRDDWGAGYVADVTITNTGTTAINGWTLSFDLDADITNLWNGAIVTRVGNRYTVRNASYNGTIAAGQSITFGFQATAKSSSRVMSNIVLNGKAV